MFEIIIEIEKLFSALWKDSLYFLFNVLSVDIEVRVRVPNESVTQKALPAVGENVTIGLKVADSYVVS